MPYLKNLWCLFALVAFCTLTLPETFAQETADFSEINVDTMSDEEIEDLINRASAAGLTTEEFLERAQAEGRMPPLQAEKLRERIDQLELGGAGFQRNSRVSNRDSRSQMGEKDISDGYFNPRSYPRLSEEEAQIFGSEIFFNNRRTLTFEPSLNQATPKSYVLGSGDLLYVDIYGQSEQYYEATVNPDGFILLDNIGTISVSGKTIEEATGIIKNRVSRFYPGMTGPNPNTFLQISLGNVRTIQVNILGDVRLPGTFTLSAFSTVFNALYAAGGPSINGSMRNIKVLRNNQLLSEVDVYDLLIKGEASLDLRLEDQDVILVPPFESRATISGQVKRPKTFEIREGDTFEDLLNYAGGFTDEAYKDQVTIARITGNERAISNVYKDQFSMFLMKGGDEITVQRILDRYTNRVQIVGAVFRPGTFALVENMMLSDLIEKAEGLRGDAYKVQASVLRTREDFSTQMFQIDLEGLLNGSSPDFALQREDVVRIASIYDIENEQYVQVLGEVKRPGIYPFSEGMEVEELLIMAGGLQETANANDIEIARRLEDQDLGTLSEIFPVQVSPDLRMSDNSVELKAFDQVIVRKRANFTMQSLVAVEGQVNSPGMFAIENSEERISDIVRRAGGLNQFAYAKGAALIRRTEFYDTQSNQERRQKNLEELQQLLEASQNNSEAQEELLRRLRSDDPIAESPVDDQLAENKRESLDQIASETPGFAVKLKETEAVAIDLEKILKNPGSEDDLILEPGDILSVPKLLQTVRMRGDVVYPTTLRYEGGRSLKYYINGAGGFERRANRKQTYVVYANGAVKRTKGFLGIRNYPPVEPGAEVIVPTKGPRVPLRLGEIVGITTGIATLALVVSQINW
ncbi:SLBB domain-containing protein [Algoriphagus sediminis]|uniref:SLBB domain-containing protein n=1 Tax=Algoriphagus sediminis TaxID=3057113 RepID=A0ABT7YC86_9BACT|nr:SLBB domain-containing protein [Algoriphagus sediminis]MDN3204142.1 SLBB domain-containing protein [Algoriphagus sediminis]